MSVSFARPLALILLLGVVAPGAMLWHRQANGLSRRERSGMLLSALALVLGVLALSGPRIATGSQRLTTLALDQSASVSDMQQVEQHWTSSVSKDNCVAPCRVVRFASAPETDGVTAQASGRGGTDLSSAITTAVGLTPHGGRVVVLSDGGQTQGDLLATSAVARARGIQVDWVPLSGTQSTSEAAGQLFAPGRNDAAITTMHVPATVRVGDRVPVSLNVYSPVDGPATLSIRRDGGPPTSQTVTLRSGDNPLLLEYTAVSQGWNSFQASIALRGDNVSINNSSAAVVDVRPAPHVLVVAGQPNSPVPSLLSRDDMIVSSTTPGALPLTAGAYTDDEAVVLDDVSATQMNSAQVAALESAVRADGMGLLVLGGPHSFSEGRYWDSPLQQILPVTSLKPGNLQRRNLAIELVLDHSGSMIDLAGGVPKIEMARAGARQAAEFIAAHRDQLGIVDFDIAAHTLVQMQRVTPGASERSVEAKIATLQAGGGTVLYAGLLAGIGEVLTSHAPERHLILMTDGISGAANYAPLEAQLRRAHISVATVALGTDADRSLLAKIAKATGGNAYVTDNANDLPRIFLKETQISSKPVRVTGKLAVSVSGDSPIVESLTGQKLPDVAGNVVVTLKRGAQADLRAAAEKGQTSPALAEWQIGAGRVVTWTPGLGSPWGQVWLGENAVWNDAVRWAQRGVTLAPLSPQPSTTVPGALDIDLAGSGSAALGVTSIDGTLTGSNGNAHSVDFTLAGPALYRADISALPAGVYHFAVTARGSSSLRASGQVALPYPAEYSPVPGHVTALGELVAQTGGRVLTPGNPAALNNRRHALDRLLALLALVAFLAGVTVRMSARLRLRIPVG